MTDGTNGAAETDGLYHVGSADDLDPGERIIVDIEGVEIAVFNVDGEYHGLLNYCVHQGGPIAEGLVSGSVTCEMSGDDWELSYEAEGERVACPWHGWQFDIRTGRHEDSSEYRIPTYEVLNRGGELYIER